jgi:2,4-dienoyl-CoA reductase-like NADH-dependent reductase (Old Yellow Enzyme family)
MSTPIQSRVFSPGKLAELELRNRVIRAGCFEGMCQNESPSELLLEHHRAVAAGGVGMTTVAYCGVSRSGLAFGHEMWMREEIVPMLKRITDAVHGEGAAASIQLGHCGFFASSRVIGHRPLGPSRKFCTFRLSVCREMTGADMAQIKEDFGKAASLAVEAGFDAVEIHSGHGYLLSQFLSPWTNHRNDSFGGPLENRMRFPVAVIRHVRETLGPQVPVLVKMNLRDGFRGGLEVDEAVEVARHYEAAGASALVLSCGFTAKTPLYMMRGKVPTREFIKAEKNPLQKIGLMLFGNIFVQYYPFQEMFLLDLARKVRKAVKMPLVLIGGICSLENMEQAMEEGFDFLQIGRATVRDPDIVWKLQRGEVKASDCDHCNRCIGEMSGGPVRCICLAEGRGLSGGA